MTVRDAELDAELRRQDRLLYLEQVVKECPRRLKTARRRLARAQENLKELQKKVKEAEQRLPIYAAKLEAALKVPGNRHTEHAREIIKARKRARR